MAMSLRAPCDEAAMVFAGVRRSAAPAAVGSWVLAATILGSSMVFIDGTVVNVALPALQRGLGATGPPASSGSWKPTRCSWPPSS